MCEQLKILFKRKEIRFLFVGGINTAIGYGIYALCLFVSLHYALAQLISTVVGVTNSYLWNKLFTFKQPRKSVSEIFRFVSVYAVCYVLNLLLLWIFIDILSINGYLAGAIGLVFTTVISYVGHNRFSFSASNYKLQDNSKGVG